jgi:GT2 family glycosyltransferase
MPHQAIIVCTRNRPDDLRTTLASVVDARPASAVVHVVDASDPAEASENRSTVASLPDAVRHVPYRDAPSLSRQRNFALDRLPTSIDVVHFIDDDVTVAPAYFSALARALNRTPSLGGVGGIVFEPEGRRAHRPDSFARRVFLLSADRPGRVLPSGCTTPSQQVPAASLNEARPHPVARAAAGGSAYRTQWLVGCSCTFRRSLLERHRFSPALEGYSMLEDLDLSYRVGREASLAVVPEARLIHRRAPANRHAVEEDRRARMIHRRWFVEKNLDHPLRTAAFWWGTLGKVAAAAASPSPTAGPALRGLLRGAQAVLRRNDPLLGASPRDTPPSNE